MYKKMNKKIIFGFIVVSLILIVGCTGGSRGKNPITDVDVRKGTDGLIMQFTKNAPPLSAFEDSVFPIALILRNRGAFDIGEDNEEEIFKKSGFLVFGFETSLVDFYEGQLKKLSTGELELVLSEEFGKYAIASGFDNFDSLLLDELKSNAFNDPRISKVFENLIVVSMVGLLEEFNTITAGDPEKYKQLLIEALKFIKSRQYINLNGKSIFNPNGDEQLITINAQTKKIGAQSKIVIAHTY